MDIAQSMRKVKGGSTSPKAHTSFMPWEISTNPIHTAKQDKARMAGMVWE